MTPVHRPHSRNAFTLMELLVVIGIITLLTAILIPVVSQVRMRGFVAQTQGEMQRIMIACQAYYHDFNAYPGPLANNMLATNTPAAVDSKLAADPTANPMPKPPAFTSTTITGSENLTLGLLGLLSPYPAPVGTAPNTGLYMPPPPKHDVMSLNYSRPASYHYLDFLPDELPTPGGAQGVDYFAYGSSTVFPPTDTSGSTATVSGKPSADATGDSSVPEFIDHIPTPMPILYMRAAPGATAIDSADGKDPGNPNGFAAYKYSQLLPYGFKNINLPDFQPPPGFTETQGGWDVYLMNPSVLNQPRGKDAFILIDAGPDRLFGTKDDIIVTP
jgi:prepilin-type N-terminal cleavage/methylation domain-containing protein